MDPHGHDLLAERLRLIPELVTGQLGESFAGNVFSDDSWRKGPYLVTGTGSSEAHARFLVHLLNRYAAIPAEFLPLSGFCDTPEHVFKGKVLAVVSQGLSPNAQVAIDQHQHFAQTVVFTSTTSHGARAAGKPERADLIKRLEVQGVRFVRSPLEEEYATLIRFVGPVAAYLSAFRFAHHLAPSRLSLPEADELQSLLATRAPTHTVDFFTVHAHELRRGFYFVTGAPLCEFAHNLSYKFLEGLFWSAPGIWDYLQFAHGPFQEVTLQPRPVILLEGPGTAERELAARTRATLKGAGLNFHAIPYAGHHPSAIFGLEMLFNDLVFQLIRRLDIDQRHWPSQGKDDPLYGFYRLA